MSFNRFIHFAIFYLVLIFYYYFVEELANVDRCKMLAKFHLEDNIIVTSCSPMYD